MFQEFLVSYHLIIRVTVSWQITLHLSFKFWLLGNRLREQNTKKELEIEYTNVIKLKCPLQPLLYLLF